MSDPRWTDADLSYAVQLAYEAGKTAGFVEAMLIGDQALEDALGVEHSYGATGPVDPSAAEVVRRFHRAVNKATWSDAERRWDRELSRAEVTT
jgi:hypothetical protein